MKLSRIDTERRLYVIETDSGYSCLGFDFAEARVKAVAAWCQAKIGDASPGTEKHFQEYIRVMEQGNKYYIVSDERCEAELIPQLKGLEGKRVEVVTCDGLKKRFIVGKSTGWLPCHLEIKTRRSTGGEAAYGAPYMSVRVVRG